MSSTLRLKADDAPLRAALADLDGLLAGRTLQLEGDPGGNLRQLFVDGVLDPSKLVRIDSDPAAGGAGDVLVSFQPSELFLELLAALRTRNIDAL